MEDARKAKLSLGGAEAMTVPLTNRERYVVIQMLLRDVQPVIANAMASLIDAKPTIEKTNQLADQLLDACSTLVKARNILTSYDVTVVCRRIVDNDDNDDKDV